MGYDELAGLYERHREGLVRTAARLLADGAAAEDVVQETWVRALERFGASRPDEPLPATGWFYRVALNLCYDRLRAARRAGTTLWGEGYPDGAHGSERGTLPVAPAAADPEEAHLAAELGEAIRAAVDSLAPLLREAILLREGAGLKYREIAAAIGCPVGTVMSRLHLARQRLKRSLGPYLGLDEGETGRQRLRPGIGQEGDGRAVAGQTR